MPTSLYAASKYAVRAIGAGLKHEMNASKSPIRITVRDIIFYISASVIFN